MYNQNVTALIGEKGAGKDSYFNTLEDQLVESGRSTNKILLNLKFAASLNTLINVLFGDITPYEKRDVPQFLDVHNEDFEVSLNLMVDSPNLTSKLVMALEETLIEREDVSKMGGGKFYATWRTLAQVLGTEVLRNVAGDDFFVKQVREVIEQTQVATFTPCAFVLTDARFGGEVALASKVYGIVRNTTSRYRYDPDAHVSELLGQTVSMAATLYRESGDETLIKELHAFCLTNNTTLAGILESHEDADGNIYFSELWTAN